VAVFDEFLLAVDEEKSQKVSVSPLPGLGLLERHLQEWVLSHPEVLGLGVAVVTSEFNKWQDASGATVADRLDVLGLGPMAIWWSLSSSVARHRTPSTCRP